jgi:hypothetical protein
VSGSEKVELINNNNGIVPAFKYIQKERPISTLKHVTRVKYNLC